MSATALVCGVTLLAVVTSVARSQSEDARLAHPHDKDHPADFSPKFADRAAWEKRADFLRHQVMVAQGLWPMPDKTPLNPVIHGRIDRDGYTIEKVFFASMTGHYVSGNLYRPKGKTGQLPAVLCPYGHWPDGRFVWKDDKSIKKELDSGAEKDPLAAKTPLQANCAMLARMGCIVFQYDMVGYCDSTKIPHREGFTDAEAILRLQSFMGLQTWNSIRALDFLLGLSDVDPQRIGVTGSSSGGMQTMALNAVDPRATVAVPIVMVSMNMQGGCVCENGPLCRVGTNNVELASLFAPKPEGMAAANDWTRDFLTRGLPEMKTIWGLYGAEQQVGGQHFDFGHNHNLHSREFEYNFLNEHLKLGWPAPVTELPFEPVSPKQLSVYDPEHPMPGDFADAVTLRRQMTKASDEQLAKLAENPQEYTKMLRVALQAMVVDAMPSADDVEPSGGGSSLPLSSAGVWNGVLSRKGAGERVPCRAVFPDRWNGTVVVWAHPGGCASLDNPAVQSLRDGGNAVVAVDVFLAGDFRAAPAPASAPASTKPNPNPPYAGYFNGYNRTVIAERAHDLLSAIAMAKSWSQTRSVRLLGCTDAGAWALLARALAGEAIDRAAIDLNGFDFDRVSSDADPMLLPGALKYGGIYALAGLCDKGSTLLCGARETGEYQRAKRDEHLTMEPASRGVGSLLDWLLK